MSSTPRRQARCGRWRRFLTRAWCAGCTCTHLHMHMPLRGAVAYVLCATCVLCLRMDGHIFLQTSLAKDTGACMWPRLRACMHIGTAGERRSPLPSAPLPHPCLPRPRLLPSLTACVRHPLSAGAVQGEDHAGGAKDQADTPGPGSCHGPIWPHSGTGGHSWPATTWLGRSKCAPCCARHTM